MGKAHVHRVAQGRFWIGTVAMRHGLGDSMGGLTEATAETKHLAGTTLVRAGY